MSQPWLRQPRLWPPRPLIRRRHLRLQQRRRRCAEVAEVVERNRIASVHHGRRLCRSPSPPPPPPHHRAERHPPSMAHCGKYSANCCPSCPNRQLNASGLPALACQKCSPRRHVPPIARPGAPPIGCAGVPPTGSHSDPPTGRRAGPPTVRLGAAAHAALPGQNVPHGFRDPEVALQCLPLRGGGPRLQASGAYRCFCDPGDDLQRLAPRGSGLRLQGPGAHRGFREADVALQRLPARGGGPRLQECGAHRGFHGPEVARQRLPPRGGGPPLRASGAHRGFRGPEVARQRLPPHGGGPPLRASGASCAHACGPRPLVAEADARASSNPASAPSLPASSALAFGSPPDRPCASPKPSLQPHPLCSLLARLGLCCLLCSGLGPRHLMALARDLVATRDTRSHRCRLLFFCQSGAPGWPGRLPHALPP
mmetsp:Transcript_2437/g.6195  ORF Transcript_2437/g.6195 Transcript_2437/m.6195 type:complete len:425 (-) Transcript_2437:397-1671(-)